MGSLTGKVVIITGSGRGLGEAYARAAAAEGATVVVNDLDSDRVAEVVGDLDALGARALGVVGDVTSPEDVTTLFDTAEREIGFVDGIICNAGLLMVGPATAGTIDEVRRMVDVNVLGTWLCGVEAIRRMQSANRPGSIVLVTSGAAMGIRGSAAYGMTKGAVVALATCWANDLEDSGIRVNAVSPFAGTRMAEQVLRMTTPDGVVDTLALASFPTAESNAPLAVYLLSDLASGVSGQLFRIDADELSMISRPALLRPSARLSSPTVAEVDRAMRQTLGRLMAPHGLVALDEGVTAHVAKRDH